MRARAALRVVIAACALGLGGASVVLADGATASVEKLVLGESPRSIEIDNPGPAGSISVAGSQLIDGAGVITSAWLSFAYPDGVVAGYVQDPPPVEFAQGQPRALSVEVENWDHRTGLTGAILVTTVAAGADGKVTTSVVRVPVEVRAGASVDVGVDAWTIESFRPTWPVGGYTHGDRGIPLLPGSTCPTGGLSMPATLVDGHKVAQGTLACAAGDTALSFERVSFEGPGTYKGTAQFGTTTLTLTDVRSVSWLEPILLILLGLALALPRGYWVTIGRAKSKRDARYDQVLADAQVAQSDFCLAARSAAYNVYDIRVGIYNWSQKQLAGKADDTTESTSAATTRQLVQEWRTAATLLESATVGAEVREFAPGYAQRITAIVTAQVGTAAGAARDLSVDELAAMLSDLTNLAAVATFVTTLHQLVEQLPKVKGPGWDATTVTRWEQLDFDVRSLTAAIAAAGSAQAISAKQSQLTKLLDDLHGLPPQPAEIKLEDLEASASHRAVVVNDPGWVFSNAVRAGKRRAIVSTLVEWTLILVSAIVGGATAFATLYSGKAWGTWPDRIALVSWALVASAFTTELTSSLTALAARRAE